MLKMTNSAGQAVNAPLATGEKRNADPLRVQVGRSVAAGGVATEGTKLMLGKDLSSTELAISPADAVALRKLLLIDGKVEMLTLGDLMAAVHERVTTLDLELKAALAQAANAAANAGSAAAKETKEPTVSASHAPARRTKPQPEAGLAERIVREANERNAHPLGTTSIAGPTL